VFFCEPIIAQLITQAGWDLVTEATASRDLVVQCNA
jgi:hypothetical protein